MIEARKGGPWQWLWDRYVDLKIRRSFRGVWVRGALPETGGGLLLYANHSSFWDGLLAHQLCRATGRDGYCMMEERNLARYPFFARIGAFSIRRRDAGSALESLRYARRLLGRPRAAVFVFPEGELQPFGAHPVVLERGIELLARMSGATCVPLGLRCLLLEHELPDAFVTIGAPHGPLPLEGYQERLAEQVRELGRITSTEGFTRMVRGGSSVAERWDRVRGVPGPG